MQKFLITTFFSLMILVGQIWQSWPDEYVHLIFCDVGQGDATLVTMGFTQMLIDGGRGDQVLSCLEEHLPFWDRTIELVVATHADADHIGGLDEVIERYDVLQIMSTQFAKDTETFLELKKAVEREISSGAILKKPILGQQMRFSQESYLPHLPTESQLPVVEVLVLSPQVEQLQQAVENSVKTETTLSDTERVFDQFLAKEDNDNDLSVVLFLQLGRIKVMLMGDLEYKGELALANANLLQNIDILKVGHHGAKTSTGIDFLSLVRPETSIVSVGKNNSYHHPSFEVMNSLMQFGSEMLRTDELGTIEIVSDGEQYWLRSER